VAATGGEIDRLGGVETVRGNSEENFALAPSALSVEQLSLAGALDEPR
jgi:hypothetical protein